MIKNYLNQDKKIAIKLKKILKNNFRPNEVVDDTNLTSNQTDSQADFLALRIIDNLIRFNQSFRLSQVPIKANMGKYKKKGSGVKFVGGVFSHEYIADNFVTQDGKPYTVRDTQAKGFTRYNGKYYPVPLVAILKDAEADKFNKKNLTKESFSGLYKNMTDNKTISADAVDYILDSVYNNVDKRDVSASKITKAAKKKLEQNLKKAVDNKTISADAVDYILDSVDSNIDKRDVSASKITKAAKKKLEQNLKKAVDNKTISADAVDYILDSVDSNIDKRDVSASKITNAAKKKLERNFKKAVDDKRKAEKELEDRISRNILEKQEEERDEALTKIKNAILNKLAKKKLKRLRDKKDDDEVAQKDLNETNTELQSMTSGLNKGKVKELVDKINSSQVLEELDNKELEDLLNQFDGDNKFPSSFEALLNAYSLIQNIGRNYRDLRPIFNNISVPVFNDLNDVLDETNELIEKSIKSFNVGNSPWKKTSISYNIDDYRDKFNKIVSIFNNIYNDFQQRKQTFNTNMKTGSGFGYLSKIRNI